MTASALRAKGLDLQLPAAGMTQRRAALTLVFATLLWSIAGVVSRQLEAARGFEVTFWRSAITAIALAAYLGARHGPAGLFRQLRAAPRSLWLSGACWGVMFTAFMVAMMLTTVANVLVTMALGPLFTALLARAWLGHRLPKRTWWTILVAGLGLAWMYSHELRGGTGTGAERSAGLGILVALSVPLAGSLMWNLLQFNARSHPDERVDMVPAILVGAVLSSLVSLPMAWPLQARGPDIGWLLTLGLFQLALPCVLAVQAGRVMPAAESALLGLLEIIFGVTWTWWSGAEPIRAEVAAGGAIVVLALAVNEALGWRASREAAPAAAAKGPVEALH